MTIYGRRILGAIPGTALAAELGGIGRPAIGPVQPWRNSSRRSWIEAMTRPIGTPISTSTASELQAGLDGLGHGVGGAKFVEPVRMARVAGARDDGQVGPQRPGHGHDRLDALRVVHGHHQRRRIEQAAAEQELRPRGVAEE